MRSDIYVFGIVLLELITGHRACDDTHGPEKHLDDWVIIHSYKLIILFFFWFSPGLITYHFLSLSWIIYIYTYSKHTRSHLFQVVHFLTSLPLKFMLCLLLYFAFLIYLYALERGRSWIMKNFLNWLAVANLWMCRCVGIVERNDNRLIIREYLLSNLLHNIQGILLHCLFCLHVLALHK